MPATTGSKLAGLAARLTHRLIAEPVELGVFMELILNLTWPTPNAVAAPVRSCQPRSPWGAWIIFAGLALNGLVATAVSYYLMRRDPAARS